MLIEETEHHIIARIEREELCTRPPSHFAEELEKHIKKVNRQRHREHLMQQDREDLIQTILILSEDNKR